MSYKSILITQESDIVTISIDRPSALNAINKDVMSSLHYFFSEGYKEYASIIGVIITGSGEKSFAAGADISEFSGLDRAEGEHHSKIGQDTFFLIERFHIPVIALVNGFALGGGCELAMSCHLRIATPKAKFGQPEVNLGLTPGYGGAQRLLQLIPKGKALELLLTADMIPAQEAYDLGLVNYVLETEEALNKANSILSKIGSKGPLAIQKTIECVNSYYDESMNGYAVGYQNFGICIASEDAKEGADAFLNKRKPNFSGS